MNWLALKRFREERGRSILLHGPLPTPGPLPRLSWENIARCCLNCCTMEYPSITGHPWFFVSDRCSLLHPSKRFHFNADIISFRSIPASLVMGFPDNVLKPRRSTPRLCTPPQDPNLGSLCVFAKGLSIKGLCHYLDNHC